MLLADVVATSRQVSATRSRKAKTQALAAVLTEAATDPELLGIVVGFLTGEVRQGRLGVGWRTVAGLDRAPATEPTLTVPGTDAVLEELKATSGPGSATRRATLLRELLAAATADEQRFLAQLLTGEVRQGALEGVMADAIAVAADVPAEAVRRAFMLSGRLPRVAAAALRDGTAALAAFRLHVGRPIRPMLASPADTLDAALADLAPASVEYKLDGARVQVHRHGDEVHVYTRTLREVTERVPELVARVRELPCRSVVLDGESLALTDDGRPRPFQESMSRFGTSVEETPHDLTLAAWFFDCLHLDGTDLLDASLDERLAALRQVTGRYRMPSLQAPDPAAAAELLESALAEGHEGVMVKALDSAYAAGRRGRAWLKVKPVHTLDLVVLGAEWGYGRRTGWLSNLHLGARDPDGGSPIMVGKTFKGLTDALLSWQTGEFRARQVRSDSHTVYVRPELVVEIELDGVQSSTRYSGGVALRFARVLRYRPDKGAEDADTIDAVRALL